MNGAVVRSRSTKLPMKSLAVISSSSRGVLVEDSKGNRSGGKDAWVGPCALESDLAQSAFRRSAHELGMGKLQP